jgi:hypothetical protein
MTSVDDILEAMTFDIDKILHQELLPQRKNCESTLLHILCHKNFLRNGALETGFFTTIMILLTLLCLCTNL